MNLTRRLAEFVVCTRTEDIPSDARDQARRAILDTLGVALAGTCEEASRIVAEMIHEQGGAEEATVLGHGFRAPVSEAALVNGTSGHALDYDDVSVSMRGHPSVPILPAVLALGEKLGVSGREVIDAFVLGFEIECKLGHAIGGPHYALGWHATSTLGTLGAASACARLLRMDAERTQAALGIAASLASGLRQNFGTMTKPLHAGWAARNGVMAASLAQRDFTADGQALEGENGFLRAASGGAEIDPQAAVRSLGDPWETVSPGIAVKLYPCCYATHRAIDAALEIRATHRIDPSLIEGVQVSVSQGTLMPLRSQPAATGLEGKFSMAYCVAAALMDGRVGLASFTDKAVQRPDAQGLCERTEVREDGPAAQFPISGVAEVSLAVGGSEYSARVETPRGDPENPLAWEELCEKFRECAGLALDGPRVGKAIEVIDRVDRMDDIRPLLQVLTC